MSAPATVGRGKPTLQIRGTTYPVLLPSWRDPRLHLAAVIVSLQVLGQVAFEFRLSIAQILVSLLTCAVLEVGIAMRRQHVLMWPASALLTGNGVAFILRVPGTEHGDWWSMNGWWIFAGTAAVSLLSKYLIQFRGRHIFNPSNFGLVLCFLLLGPELADPLEFWWGPMSLWLALALALIVGGGFAILRRLRLLSIALTFWATFAVVPGRPRGERPRDARALAPRTGLGLGVLEGPRLLARDPRLPVLHDHGPADDPGEPAWAPGVRRGDRVAGGAPARAADDRVRRQGRRALGPRARLRGATAAPAAPARPPLADAAGRRRSTRRQPYGGRGRARGRRRVRRPARRRRDPGPLERGSDGSARARRGRAPRRQRPKQERGSRRSIGERRSGSRGTSSPTSRTSRRPFDARDRERATAGADGARLAAVWRQIDAAGGGTVDVPRYEIERVRVTLEPSDGQAPPTVVARVAGTVELRGTPRRFVGTFELVLKDGRYLITAARGQSEPSFAAARSDDLGGVSLHDVAAEVGLDFRHGAFRFGVTNEPEAMMGGGLCWLDYDNDGWLDLFVVNAYGDDELRPLDRKRRTAAQRALPQRARPVRGRQQRVRSRPAAARQRLRRGGLQPGRQHGSLRDDGRLQRGNERLRRAALGATETARSRKAPARPGSTTRAGIRVLPSGT